MTTYHYAVYHLVHDADGFSLWYRVRYSRVPLCRYVHLLWFWFNQLEPLSLLSWMNEWFLILLTHNAIVSRPYYSIRFGFYPGSSGETYSTECMLKNWNDDVCLGFTYTYLCLERIQTGVQLLIILSHTLNLIISDQNFHFFELWCVCGTLNPVMFYCRFFCFGLESKIRITVTNLQSINRESFLLDRVLYVVFVQFKWIFFFLFLTRPIGPSNAILSQNCT